MKTVLALQRSYCGAHHTMTVHKRNDWLYRSGLLHVAADSFSDQLFTIHCYTDEGWCWAWMGPATQCNFHGCQAWIALSGQFISWTHLWQLCIRYTHMFISSYCLSVHAHTRAYSMDTYICAQSFTAHCDGSAGFYPSSSRHEMVKLGRYSLSVGSVRLVYPLLRLLHYTLNSCTFYGWDSDCRMTHSKCLSMEGDTIQSQTYSVPLLTGWTLSCASCDMSQCCCTCVYQQQLLLVLSMPTILIRDITILCFAKLQKGVGIYRISCGWMVKVEFYKLVHINISDDETSFGNCLLLALLRSC